MTETKSLLEDIHRLMDVLQNIDVGLVVLDQELRVQLWNNFMESHSGMSPQKVLGRVLYQVFPEIDAHWLKQKTAPVFQLRSRAFTHWQQRPYLFHFRNCRPITGRTTMMYQNVSFIPMEETNREVRNICLIVYDVTDVAVQQQMTEHLEQALHSR